MDRERLEQYEKLNAELSRLRKEIRQIDRAAKRSEDGICIPDVATGSSPEYPYLHTRVKVESVDKRKFDGYIQKLKSREKEYHARVIELEDWLEDIEDPLLYRIFKLKLKDGMSDKRIGDELGYSRSRITQMINGHLKD